MESTDALSQILRSFRMESGLISRGHFTAPWAVHSRGLDGAVFHAVVQGRCLLQRDGDPQPIALEAGEMAVLTRGDGHTVRDPESGCLPVPVTRLTPRPGGGVPVVEHGGGGAAARVLCGRFRLAHGASETLNELLPPVIVVRRQQARVVEWLDTTMDLIAFELDHRRPGSDEILVRLTDILFVQVLRTYALSLEPGQGGWLGALKDPPIAHALALLHDTPDARWTAEDLARQVGMSRSTFFARFSASVGEPPSRYLTRWRMRAAADLMSREDLSTADLAERVGYSSEDSFSRAFRRTLGVSPSAWRRGERRAVAGAPRR